MLGRIMVLAAALVLGLTAVLVGLAPSDAPAVPAPFVLSDDDGDDDRTRGNDVTGGGNNTGDGDRTEGNDGTNGGDNTGGGGGTTGGGTTGGGGGGTTG